jgi:hypothetical protein
MTGLIMTISLYTWQFRPAGLGRIANQPAERICAASAQALQDPNARGGLLADKRSALCPIGWLPQPDLKQLVMLAAQFAPQPPSRPAAILGDRPLLAAGGRYDGGGL